jgi:hypothetical protein
MAEEVPFRALAQSEHLENNATRFKRCRIPVLHYVERYKGKGDKVLLNKMQRVSPRCAGLAS